MRHPAWLICNAQEVLRHALLILLSVHSVAHTCVPPHAWTLTNFLLEKLLVVFVLLSILHQKLSQARVDFLPFILGVIFPLLVGRLWTIVQA